MDIIMMSSIHESYSFFYRVNWSSDTPIPRAFQQLQISPGLHVVYAPALFSLIPENDSIYDFFEWAPHPTNDFRVAYCLHLRRDVTVAAITELINARLLRLAFVIDPSYTAISFTRLDRVGYVELGWEALLGAFYTHYRYLVQRGRVGRLLSPVTRGLFDRRLEIYAARRTVARELLDPEDFQGMENPPVMIAPVSGVYVHFPVLLQSENDPIY